MKKYCFNCNQENDYYVKKEKVKHVIHGVELNIEQDNYYCSKCHEEIDGGTIDDELKTVAIAYLDNYGLSYESMISIRKKFNLTQELFANVMGWSNKSVVRYEKGQSIPQKEYINAYLELALNPYNLFYNLEKKKDELKESYDLIIERLKKSSLYKNMNILLFFLNKKGLYKTQINKLAFFSDFLDIKNNKKQISSFRYAHAPYGPVIDDFDEAINDLIQANIFYFKIDDDDKTIIYANIKCHEEIFDKNELFIMNDVYKKYGNLTSKQLSDISHDFIGWKNTKDGEIIDTDYAKELNV